MAQHRYLSAPTYLIAFSLFLIPPLESLITVFPFRLGDARWRFGAFGLLSSSLLLSLVGLLMAVFATAVFENPRFRRVLGAIAGLLAIAVAAAWIVFALDALQVRKDVNPAAAFAFKKASAIAASKALVAIVTLITLTAAAFRGPRAPAKTPRSGLIVGGRASQSLPTPDGARDTAPANPG
ncbi:MAG TPA: hypothetical protein VIP11_19740 [Gemmatimonadaceae bacterium]